MGRLEQLNVFRVFVVGEDKMGDEKQSCSLEELSLLLQLRELSVGKLERALTGRVMLENKHSIKNLNLFCTPPNRRPVDTDKEIHRIEELFSEVVPPRCLENLSIDGYFDRRFLTWMMSSSLATYLPQLRYLTLSNCTTALQVLLLGLLPEPSYLKFSSASEITNMGSEFLGCGVTSVAFPKLEVLEFIDMPNLQEWSLCEEGEELTVFPNLRQLTVMSCPELEALPMGLKHSPFRMLCIRSFGLRGIDSLLYLSDSLDIFRFRNMETICDLPAPRRLH